MTFVSWSVFRHTVLEALTTRGVGGCKESSKVAVHKQPDVQGCNTNAEHSSAHLPLSCDYTYRAGPGYAVGEAGGRLPVLGRLRVRTPAENGETLATLSQGCPLRHESKVNEHASTLPTSSRPFSQLHDKQKRLIFGSSDILPTIHQDKLFSQRKVLRQF